jgi:CubicO group peptidase (beta-lactamase class C family)
LDNLIGQDLKTANLSIFDATGGIVASLPDVSRWVRAMFSNTLLPAKQKDELFSLVSVASGQPIREVSKEDKSGFSLGIFQVWEPFLVNPILWTYTGQSLGYTATWFRRPGDELVVVITANGAPAQIDFLPLYKKVLGILEPQCVVDPDVAQDRNRQLEKLDRR